MHSKGRYLLIIGSILACTFIAFGALHILPLHLFSIQEKPEVESQKLYDYYIIVDEVDSHSLMYVPLVVNIGDEVLTEENKRYKVVRIEENRAYARFIEDVNLQKYKKK